MIFVGIDPGKRGGFAKLEHIEGGVAHVSMEPFTRTPMQIGGPGRVYIRLSVKPTPIIPGKTRKILDGLATKKQSREAWDQFLSSLGERHFFETDPALLYGAARLAGYDLGDRLFNAMVSTALEPQQQRAALRRLRTFTARPFFCGGESPKEYFMLADI